VRLRNYIAFLGIVWATTLNAQTVAIVDGNFKKCLADSLPNVLDANQNLVIAQASAATKLHCPNYGIGAIPELPYFTALQELNLTKNPIVVLPPIANPQTMLVLNIGETGLTALPDLKSFTNLQWLSIHRLSLTTFPDLSKNTKLIRLTAHTNNFDSMPNLNLPVLERLEISLANLDRLPDLSNLKKLRQLECFRNKLTQLPNMLGLDSLKILDASTNAISKVPSLPLGINTLYIDNNALTTLPDLKAYARLTKVRLYGNRLSFEDLLPLTTIVNYAAIYEVMPQKSFEVGKSFTVVELDSVDMDSKVDSNIVGVLRKWYFNDVVTTQTVRNYRLKPLKLSDQGYYYCVLSHPSMPNVTLQTDKFYLGVQPCVNLDGVSTEIIGSTCLKQGSLKVNLSNQSKTDYKFELEGQQSHKHMSSTTGLFPNLGEAEYKLTISRSNGCIYTLPTALVVPKENCTQIVITPNEDGIDDTYYFAQTGQAKLVDKWGNVVLQLALPKLWDGYMNDHKMPVGYYIVNVNNGEEILKLSVIY
jgi:hypothetical protein